jgi:glycosyl-4,4'-diaponeurosporenoate acyltransferase
MLALDVAIYALLCASVTMLSLPLPARWFHRDGWLLRGRVWEHGGSVYQTLFRVRRWKTLLPEVADVIGSEFPKKTIRSFDSGYVMRYLQESRKAELTHWCIIASSAVFLTLGTPRRFIIMLAVAVVTNLPFIVIQRYNRPRIEAAMARRDDRASGLRRVVRSS